MRSLFHFLKLKHPVRIGLDIHPEEVRLLQLAYHKKQLCIEKTAVFPLPAGTIVDGKIKHHDIVQSAMMHVIDATQTAGSPVVLALPAQTVISKYILLPAVLNDEECELDIRNRLQHYLPGMTEELYFDFVRLRSHDAHHDHALLMAARVEQVNATVEMVKQAGLFVAVIDVDSYALLRAATFFLSPSDEITAVLELGCEHAQLIIYQQYDIYLSQSLVFNKHLDDLCEQLNQILQRIFLQKPTQSLRFVVTGADEKYLSDFKEMMKNQVSIDVVILDLSAVLSPSQRILSSLGLALRGLHG